MPTMHPADELLTWLSAVDFAVLKHGWPEHGRDYVVVVQDSLGGDPGTHMLIFTHCVQLDYVTRVPGELWRDSWSDEFLDYSAWERAGEPEGYVWGTNWSNAYPGLKAVKDSAPARAWSKSAGKPFHEITLETDRFFMRLVFHSIRTSKLSDDTETISRTILPL
jgi:hypothetical protein